MKLRILTVAVALLPASAMACTNFIVGKKASADGSVICTYNADDYGLFGSLPYQPAAIHAKGDVRRIIDYDTAVLHGTIPEAAETYAVMGHINEWQVTIGETTFGGKEACWDSTGIMDYGSLMYVALQRAKTARQAIKVMTTLAETYGYCSEGETFTICDPDEAWIMEMQAQGQGSKKVVWVAQRIPDDAICAHANQSRIRKFDMKDKENVMYSKDVVKYARRMGWFDGKDEDFSFCEAYAEDDFSARRYCEARVWSFFNHFVKGMEQYVAYAEGKDLSAQPMPLWFKPDRKVSVHDVMMAMRDHYEGTPFDLSHDQGGGIWEMPYRPTPLTFKVDDVQYFNERPTSTQQTGFTFVSQMRSWLPRQIGGVLWFGNDDPNMIAYTPIYCCNTRVPKCYATPGADAVTFSWDNAFWLCNWVSNMVYPRYSLLFPDLKQLRDSLEGSYLAAQREVEERAAMLLKESEASAVDYLTSYSERNCRSMMENWKELGMFLVVKYNDMAVKPTDATGRFMRTPTGLGARVSRPSYGKNFARRLVKEIGATHRVPVPAR